MADASARSDLPAYLQNAAPVPLEKRAPWYMNTAPTYAGIFLWIAFYMQLGQTLKLGHLWAVLIGVVLAGAVCYMFFYYVPGLLGLKTGMPLYIVGTSAFGAKGGYFIPGIFMGLLQIGWYSVATFFATKLVLNGFGQPAVTPLGPLDRVELDAGVQSAFDPTFIGLAIAWGLLFAFIGALGIAYVAKVAQFFPVVPIVMLLIGAALALPYVFRFSPPAQSGGHEASDLDAALFMIHLVVGFFGTAGAVGADFCANNRNEQDVKWGGIAGIWGAVVFAAGLAVITVAGAYVHNAEAVTTGGWTYQSALEVLGPEWLKRSMLILFAIGSMAPACFCSFIIGNSLSTMLGMPKARIPLTLGGAMIGILIAITGASANLVPYFGLIGASFGPVIGAMIADFFLQGGRWTGPREGINWAGYIAWGVGFLVGMSNNEVVTRAINWQILADWHPTGVYSLVVGFFVYIIVARTMGLPARIEGAVPTIGPRE